MEVHWAAGRFARVITDHATFSWPCDVFVLAAPERWMERVQEKT